MAKRGVVLSNNDSRVTFSDTGSLSIDDVTNNVSASYVSASSLGLPGVNSSGIKLLSASSGVISTFPNGAINNSAIAWNGTRFVTSSIIPQTYVGTAGGDLSGSYDEDIKVTNVENVYYGALPVNHGGTGTSLEIGINDIVKVSSSAGSTPQFSTITAASGSILTSVSGVLSADLPWYMPKVEIYTKPGTYTWKKPDGIRFARVITQGAGGSGGNGARNTVTWAPGGGGGAGGFAEGTFEISSISNATITVGAGGAQQRGTIAAGTALAGNAGGSSSFVATGINIYGNGGNAGAVGSITVAAAAGGTSGGGSVVKTGGSSNSYNTINSVYDAPAGGGVGESYLGTVGTAGVQNSATVNKILSSSGLFGYNYNVIDNVVPQMTTAGGAGADPTAIQSDFYDDPTVLLHMKPFYEKKVDLSTTSSYNPTISYDSSAGWTTSSAPFVGGTSFHPWRYSTNNTLNTGSATITPGYNLTGSDFTWESWVYLNSTGSNGNPAGDRMYLVDTRNGAGSANKYLIATATGGKLAFYAGTGASMLLTSSAVVSVGSWQHIALVRSSGTFRFYINGVQDTNSYTAAWSLTDATNIRLGNSSQTNNQQFSLDGYMSDIRLSNVARYTSNYTVPTASFIKDSNTILLINGPEYDNAITNQTVDSSYHGRQVAFNGAANLTQSLTAFGDTAYVLSPMSTTNKTGSITVSPGENLATRDFTVEGWVYLKSIGSNSQTMHFFDTRNGANTNANKFLLAFSSQKLGFFTGTTGSYQLLSSGTVPLNTWSHIAFVRHNSTLRFYINGVQDSNSFVGPYDFNDINSIRIGASSIAAEAQFSVDGFMDEFRITPKALYTASFTPSTTRFSDPYNPILLLHMDPLSGSANKTLDSSKSKNDIYFAGVQTQAASASISNTVGNPFNQYGNSMLLSGSATSSPALTVVGAPATKTEPFTLECWVYRTANSIEPSIYDSRSSGASAAGFYFSVATTGQLRIFSNNAYQYTSNLSIPLNRWTHVALVRNGTNSNTSVYINGERDTKNLTLSSTFNFTDSRIILGAPHNAQNYTLYGYMDEVRISKCAIYTGSYINLPTTAFPDPTGFQYNTISTGSSGIYGSGGGGGGNTPSHLQEINRAYLGGKGGDGYVAIISW